MQSLKNCKNKMKDFVAKANNRETEWVLSNILMMSLSNMVEETI